MRHESESTLRNGAIEKRGKALPRGAIHCTTFLPAVARLRWPKKTAFHWAAASGVKERMAKYWLARKHAVSDSGVLALMDEIRNSRVAQSGSAQGS